MTQIISSESFLLIYITSVPSIITVANLNVKMLNKPTTILKNEVTFVAFILNNIDEMNMNTDTINIIYSLKNNSLDSGQYAKCSFVNLINVCKVNKLAIVNTPSKYNIINLCSDLLIYSPPPYRIRRNL